MEIVCFSSGRAGRILTLSKLPSMAAERCVVVVPWGQGHAYRESQVGNVVETPQGVNGIARRRQWWLEHTQADKLLMLDDDLRFYTRRRDDVGKFLASSDIEVGEVLADIERQLDKYVHLTMMSRLDGNFKGGRGAYFEVGRSLRVHGLRPKVIRGLGCRFDRLSLMEDMDMTLQLLRLGLPNRVINYMVHGQGASNAPGGCSLYRTPELQAAAARGLAELHRPHVRLVECETKASWGGGKRIDVVVQWQKAYQEGLSVAQGVEQKELL